MVETHWELLVFQKAFGVSMEIFEVTKTFPKAETYALTDQIRRSSRSVAANVTEAWRKRRYEAAFIAKLCDAEAEAAETQTWLRFAESCGYLDSATADNLMLTYEEILRLLVSMIHNSARWTTIARK